MAKYKAPRRKKIKVKKEIILTWRDRGWVAQIIQDEDGGGWAVTMTREGDAEPAYVGPWTMGRNKIDPKPMTQAAFNTWVKSASEFLARSQRQIRTADRRTFTLTTDMGEQLTIIFDIERGDFEAEGILSAEDIYGSELARVTVEPTFKLTIERAEEWVLSGFARPQPTDEPAYLDDAVDEVWDADAAADEGDTVFDPDAADDGEVVFDPDEDTAFNTDVDSEPDEGTVFEPDFDSSLRSDAAPAGSSWGGRAGSPAL